MVAGSLWRSRPTASGALLTAAWVGLLAAALAWSATRLSPFSARSQLALASGEYGELDELYLTPLAQDPARVLLTTQRQNSTWARDQASQAGDPYWIRRYGDPARPGLPQRILLTSRSRGARLLIPLAALDLERALSEPLVEDPPPAAPLLRRSLIHVYWSRSFAGVFLHLRFPERELATEGPEAGQPLDFDLVIVRGNQLCTTDFLLQPNGELYRAALADGLLPAGPLRRNPLTEDELVLLMRAEPGAPGVPLYSPVALLDELRLCWGTQLGTVLDDRWRPQDAAPFALRPPAPEVRARLAWDGALHLAARFESADERRALQQALARFTGS